MVHYRNMIYEYFVWNSAWNMVLLETLKLQEWVCTTKYSHCRAAARSFWCNELITYKTDNQSCTVDIA